MFHSSHAGAEGAVSGFALHPLVVVATMDGYTDKAAAAASQTSKTRRPQKRAVQGAEHEITSARTGNRVPARPWHGGARPSVCTGRHLSEPAREDHLRLLARQRRG